MGGLPGRCDTGQRGEPGAVPSHQARGGLGPGTRAGGCGSAAWTHTAENGTTCRLRLSDITVCHL